jgi:hypothetical protein
MDNITTVHKYDDHGIIMCKAKGLYSSTKWEDVNCPQCRAMRKTEIKLIPHDGGPCPVEGIVIIKFRNGYILMAKETSNLRWRHTGADSDIIAYCPIEIKEGE